MEANWLQQEFRIESRLSFKKQKMSPNPIRKTSHIFEACSQPISSAIPSFTISNTLSVESPVDLAEAFNTYFSSILIMGNLPHSQTHALLTSARFSFIPFDVDGIMTVMKCTKSSYSSGPDCLSSVLFRTAGPGLPLLRLIRFCFAMHSGYSGRPRLSFHTRRWELGSQWTNFQMISVWGTWYHLSWDCFRWSVGAIIEAELAI